MSGLAEILVQRQYGIAYQQQARDQAITEAQFQAIRKQVEAQAYLAQMDAHARAGENLLVQAGLSRRGALPPGRGPTPR